MLLSTRHRPHSHLNLPLPLQPHRRRDRLRRERRRPASVAAGRCPGRRHGQPVQTEHPRPVPAVPGDKKAAVEEPQARLAEHQLDGGEYRPDGSGGRACGAAAWRGQGGAKLVDHVSWLIISIIPESSCGVENAHVDAHVGLTADAGLGRCTAPRRS
jgi:hypothetical protein